MKIVRLLLVPALLSPLPAQPLRLSLQRAVEIALAPEDGNARVQLAREMVRQSESRSAQARAALLPDISGAVGAQSLTRNLEAMGIRVRVPIPGFEFPTFVGPFSVYDARASLTANLLDVSAIRRFQASRTGVKAARSESEAVRDEVAALVARAYMAALRADAQLEAAQANVKLAEALLSLAENQRTAGTGTGIEVTRARNQLANQRQRLLVSENERNRARWQLLRAMDVDLDTALELTGRLEYTPPETTSVEQSLKTALESRADWKAQARRMERARLNHSAVKYERLPSLVGFADYGSIGSSLDRTLPTRTYGVSLRVPVFDGGRRDARRGESASEMRQETIRERDLRRQIELEIRTALDNLASAESQVKVAEEGLGLSEQELAQAQRRYKAGVANSLEVTDAQTRFERAQDNRIAALFNYSQARIDLAQAMGTIQRIVK
ncbi:MAG: TolC family protein [Bryobacterales bacterium]|nr:TolC family protein [Bryobacterales bacterium]